MTDDLVLKTTLEVVDAKKGDHPVILDLRGISILTDYFLVVGGLNTTHVRTIADAIKDRLEELGVQPQRIEGYKEGRWILLDYSHLVIHILAQEERDFYRLEELWHEAKVIEPSLA
ncbi:MAG TPA: ribosome silencing factor [Bacillota bacterium]